MSFATVCRHMCIVFWDSHFYQISHLSLRLLPLFPYTHTYSVIEPSIDELIYSSHPASFRFHLAMDTLAFGYILPTTGWIWDLHPLETCAARRTLKKAPKQTPSRCFSFFIFYSCIIYLQLTLHRLLTFDISVLISELMWRNSI